MNSRLFTELNNSMIKYRFRPKKNFSQNFAIDEKLIESIVSFAELNAKDKVLEIGCGTGALTRELLKKSKVIGIEVDEQLNLLLKDEFLNELNSKKFVLIEGDFLNAKIPEFNKVVSLPPYAISTSIIYRLAEFKFDFALLVFQKDFVQKILSEPGFSDYGASAVALNYFFEPEILIESVSQQSFYPQPSIDSVLLKLTPKKRFGKAKNDKKFIAFIKELFRFKNKNLRNSLDKSLPFIQRQMNLKKKNQNELLELIPKELLEQKTMLLEVSELVELFNKMVK